MVNSNAVGVVNSSEMGVVNSSEVGVVNSREVVWLHLANMHEHIVMVRDHLSMT